MKEAASSIRSADANIGAARARLKPSVDFSASLDYRHDIHRNKASNNDFSQFTKKMGLNRSAAMNVRWTLYAGGRQRAGCRSAELTAYKERLDQESVKRSMIHRCRSEYLQYQAHRKNLAAAREAYNQSLAALKASNDEYIAGGTSMMDLLGIEQQYTVALFHLMNALSECTISYYECQALMGKMNAHSLGLNVNTFDANKYPKDHSYAFFGLGNASKQTLFPDGKNSESFPINDQCQDQSIDTGCTDCARPLMNLAVEPFSFTVGKGAPDIKTKE